MGLNFMLESSNSLNSVQIQLL